MSTRVRSKQVGPDVVVAKYSYDGVDYAAGNQTSFSEEWNCTDIVDENFHARRMSGEVFNNPCTITVSRKRHSDNMGICRWYWNQAPDMEYVIMTQGNLTEFMVSGTIFSNWNVPTPNPVLSDPVKQAKHFCLSHVDSTPYEFFEDLAEIRETIEFLRAPLHSIRSLHRAFKRKMREARRIRDIQERANAIGNVWKQYRFALAPLIRSIMSAWEALANFEDLERPKRRTAHGFAEDTADPNSESIFTFFPLLGEYRYHYFDKLSTKMVEAHAAIYYEVTNPIVDWKFALGLRLKDVPVTAWEVIPLSFMVDRLFHVKNMLTGLINIVDPTVTFLAGSVTTKTTESAVLTGTNMSSSHGLVTYDFQSSDSITFDEFEYKRDIWSPSFFDTIPSLTWKNVVKDITSILDLLSIVIGKLPKL